MSKGIPVKSVIYEQLRKDDDKMFFGSLDSKGDQLLVIDLIGSQELKKQNKDNEKICPS